MKPPAGENWETLPLLSGENIRSAVASFPWSTGIGKVPFSPRLLEQASAEAMDALRWPSCSCGASTS